MGAECSARRYWDTILSALLPQRCLLCGESGDAPLCPTCRQSLPIARGLACPVCGEAAQTAEGCSRCRRRPPRFDATFAPCLYAFPVDKLVHTLKYGHCLAVADVLADLMLTGTRPDGDLIIPVPLAAVRLRQRGFNQALEISRHLARVLEMPLLANACTKPRETVAQASLPWHTRRRNVQRAFDCTVDLSGRRVIVVDDVMTTGATLDELARVLKERGAVRVINWVAARTRRSHFPD